jgi:hypothetical protein
VTEVDWTPPDGMFPPVARAWREFFRKAASGTAGYTATPDMYVVLYRAQLGRCFICQIAKGINPDDPKGRGSQRLGWDHNHATGMVRGLLCTKGEWSCNRIVGRYRDDPMTFHRAYRYLFSPPALVLTQAFRAALDTEDRARVARALLGVSK